MTPFTLHSFQVVWDIYVPCGSGGYQIGGAATTTTTKVGKPGTKRYSSVRRDGVSHPNFYNILPDKLS